MPRFLRGRGGQTLAASVAYVALTIVMTWPVAQHLAGNVPADLGDSLFVMWAMAWDAEALMAMAAGTASFADLWQANIFHPTTLALTFSEHLLPQAVQGLPVYLATGNIVLAYNVVFLGTFALSGLGMFLFVRELTGRASVAFVAGLFYAFLPYRLNQVPHLQTLSSQWMPLALFGFRRYFESGRVSAVVAGVAAFVVQGLSTGYYLFYFAPVLAGYVLWELTVRRRLGHLPTWLAMASAGLASLVVMLPFLLPYREARASFGLERPVDEVLRYSADLYAYLNAAPPLHFWGSRLTLWPQTERDLFFGAVPLVLALAAVALWLWQAARASADWKTTGRRGVRGRVWLTLAAASVAMAVVLGVTGGIATEIAGLPVRVTSPLRALVAAAIFVAVALLTSPRLRASVRAHPADLTPFLVMATVFAVLMSLGPVPRAGGERLAGVGPYDLFYDWVPGFDGLRVPARFAMVAAMLVAVLSGYALAPLSRLGRRGMAITALLGALFLAETYAAPLAVNLSWQSNPAYAPAWATVHRLNDGPLAYRHLLAMPADTVVLELPFGDGAWDLRYVYYAGLHGKRIVNGYSGYFPRGYIARAVRLQGLWADREAAWEALVTSGATHVLVHELAFPPAEGAAVSVWLEQQGARRAATFADGDVLLTLPSPPR